MGCSSDTEGGTFFAFSEGGKEKQKEKINFLKIYVDKMPRYGYNNKAPFKCKQNMAV